MCRKPIHLILLLSILNSCGCQRNGADTEVHQQSVANPGAASDLRNDTADPSDAEPNAAMQFLDDGSTLVLNQAKIW